MTVWSDSQRGEALALYVDVGPSEAARRTGIPKSTIHDWAAKEGLSTDAVSEQTIAATIASAERAAAKREQARELMLDRILDALGLMQAAHTDFRGRDATEVHFERAPSGAWKDYAMTVGILLDKYRLEMGESTGRFDSDARTPSEVLAQARSNVVRFSPRAS